MDPGWPTSTLFTPLPVFTVVNPPIAHTLTVSFPYPLLRVVTAPLVPAIVNVLPPEPSERFKAPTPL